jgi:hypothetical protein
VTHNKLIDLLSRLKGGPTKGGFLQNNHRSSMSLSGMETPNLEKQEKSGKLTPKSEFGDHNLNFSQVSNLLQNKLDSHLDGGQLTD